MRRVVIIVLSIAMAITAWGLDEESAKDAVEQAFPDAPYARQAAVFQLLNTLEDGDTLTVMINDQVGSFAIREGRVILQRLPELPADVREEDQSRAPEEVTPPEKPEDVPKPPEPQKPKAGFRSAMVVSLDLQEPLNLDLLNAEIEGAGRRIAVSTPDATSFYMATEGDFVTVTATGTVCVRTRKPMHTLGTVDQLRAEAVETLGYVTESSRNVERTDADRAMKDPTIYSDPAGTMHRLVFLGQEGRWMSPRFSATLQVPEATITDARLLVHILREDDIVRGVNKVAPRILFNGETLVRPRVKVTDYQADITGHIHPGDNTLGLSATSTASDIATGCRFVFELVFEEAPGTPITATVRTATVEAEVSRPMSALETDYSELKTPG